MAILHWLRMMLVGLFTVLAACATPSTNLIRSSEKGPAAHEGIVVLKLAGTGPGIMFGLGPKGWGLNTAMREEGSQRHFYFYGSETRQVAFHVPAGTYSFVHFSPRRFMPVREPLLDLPYSPTQSIPVRPITVRAGEVVYLGDLLVHGIGFEDVVAANRPGVAYSLTLDEGGARERLEKDYPGSSARMVTRPFEIEPAATFSQTGR